MAATMVGNALASVAHASNACILFIPPGAQRAAAAPKPFTAFPLVFGGHWSLMQRCCHAPRQLRLMPFILTPLLVPTAWLHW